MHTKVIAAQSVVFVMSIFCIETGHGRMTNPRPMKTLKRIAVGLLLLTLAVADDIDLGSLTPNGKKGFRILGGTGVDNTGFSVSAAGDMNADGIADVAVSANYADPPSKTEAGIVYVIFGRSLATQFTTPFNDIQLPVSGTPLPSTVGFRILGSAANDNLGQSVSAAGDVNDDGVDDLILSATQADVVGKTNAGITYVIYGRSLTTQQTNPFGDIQLTTGGIALPLDVGFRIIGAVGGDQSGHSVSSAGDVNGDGVDDIIIGACNADTAAGADAGAAYVIYGRSMTTQQTTPFGDIQLTSGSTALASTVGFRMVGTVAVANSGGSVSAAGDVNADGVGDVLVGAFGGDPPGGRTDAGITYVIYGRSVTTQQATPFGDISLPAGSTTMPANVGFRIFGASANDYSGSAVSAAGDVNNDGVDDIIIGVSLANSNKGISYVIFGRSGTKQVTMPFGDIQLPVPNTPLSAAVGFRVLGTFSMDNSGVSVSSAGDFNGDGVDDLIIGANNADPTSGAEAGISYVVLGRDIPGGANAFGDNQLVPGPIPASVGFRITGAAGNDQSGISVSKAGDINGDGIDDVVIGANNADAAYVVFGFNLQPTSQPSNQPSGQPSVRPSRQPTRQPSIQPSSQPSAHPSRQPSTMPTSQPTLQPSSQPSRRPTRQPSNQPSAAPSRQPTRQPSTQPSAQPSNKPSRQPSLQPSSQPSRQPSKQPTEQPSRQPCATPSSQPSRQPSAQPSAQPSTQPSKTPSSQPSGQPSCQPSRQPSTQPSRHPSFSPSKQPSVQPSTQPSGQPTAQPSRIPSAQPSRQPSQQPSKQPTAQPTRLPSTIPTRQPSHQPSAQPSTSPSRQPSKTPSSQPSRQPLCQPTRTPSSQPSQQPSASPSGQPSSQPSALPSTQPSCWPSRQPSTQPSHQPSTEPSRQPTARPSGQPSATPSSQPSRQPSVQPTVHPTTQPGSMPSGLPTCQPSGGPSGQPSLQPSSQPTQQPTGVPSAQPSSQPSAQPSPQSSTQPSGHPSAQPSGQPSAQPMILPSAQPTRQPSIQPTTQPQGYPSSRPSARPRSRPSNQPSSQPSSQPSMQPMAEPTNQPLALPSVQPSGDPSAQPTTQPSNQISVLPTSQPSSQPSSNPSIEYTGEWVIMWENVTDARLNVGYAMNAIWFCGSLEFDVAILACAVINPLYGAILDSYILNWITATSIHETTPTSTFDTSIIMMSGLAFGEVSTVAACSVLADSLNCTVMSFMDARLVGVSESCHCARLTEHLQIIHC